MISQSARWKKSISTARVAQKQHEDAKERTSLDIENMKACPQNQSALLKKCVAQKQHEDAKKKNITRKRKHESVSKKPFLTLEERTSTTPVALKGHEHAYTRKREKMIIENAKKCRQGRMPPALYSVLTASRVRRVLVIGCVPVRAAARPKAPLLFQLLPRLRGRHPADTRGPPR